MSERVGTHAEAQGQRTQRMAEFLEKNGVTGDDHKGSDDGSSSKRAKS